MLSFIYFRQENHLLVIRADNDNSISMFLGSSCTFLLLDILIEVVQKRKRQEHLVTETYICSSLSCCWCKIPVSTLEWNGMLEVKICVK